MQGASEKQDAPLTFVTLVPFQELGIKSKYYKERCSYCFSDLGDYNSFRCSGQKPWMKTKRHISSLTASPQTSAKLQPHILLPTQHLHSTPQSKLPKAVRVSFHLCPRLLHPHGGTAGHSGASSSPSKSSPPTVPICRSPRWVLNPCPS